eukprot:TRINITY_DN2272_c0_g1_i2.p1 TRINITY_DN2272_c0_g1~~TRINITY_DN2272_c0_g1_i2.p1  ORF type:complete len:235 (+),score=35.65 TRINITY_DN2272_c0_g1_i2:136-840(+)
MKMILLHMLLLGVWSVAEPECKAFNCNTTRTKDICGVWGFDRVDLSMCQTGMLCALPYETSDKAICVNTTTYPHRLPGEYCDNPEQCLYNKKCEKNICRGKEEGQPCKLDGECDVELYCYKGGCTSPADSCKGGRKCRSNQVCSNEQCVCMGQLENGAEASVPAACKSYYIRGTRCSKGPRLVRSDRVGYCRYDVEGDVYYYDAPLCTFGSPSKIFCPPGRGNVDMYAVSVGCT